MMKTELRHLVHDPDKRGNDRYYVRIKGRPKIRIRETFKDAKGNITREFMAAYWAAMAALQSEQAPKKPELPREETFNWLFDQYYRSAAFKNSKLIRRGTSVVFSADSQRRRASCHIRSIAAKIWRRASRLVRIRLERPTSW
ncbi:hypothetical protein [Rhizobium sp. CNPSo 4039]|uniref:hypothetical protein n=1 Tax=Rhizobium sp. CNPSo 4039 TaxID=3021409 RepID=UPI00254AC436|nr:hypothetical protein [Rhizobium sp. CNPSo 4039]MDK4714688.1 hypothetical protein [Rhizobium sp. CNPSo 4039]